MYVNVYRFKIMAIFYLFFLPVFVVKCISLYSLNKYIFNICLLSPRNEVVGGYCFLPVHLSNIHPKSFKFVCMYSLEDA